MKTKWIALIVLLASLFSMRAATNDLTMLLQKGLFEEEANHNLEAAMQAYQSAIAEHDKDRKLVATAVFRLGECYRKQGKTNEASAQYQRVLREFPDQDPLVKLSKSYLGQGAAVQLAQDSTPIATTSEEDEEVRGIKAMIQNSPDLIDATPANGKTPLQTAAKNGHLKTAEYLLANGADPNRGAPFDAPIYLAAQNGHKAMVELLLAHGAKVEKTGALRAAASRGFKGVVEALIAAKADVNEGSPLYAAAGQGSKAVVELLIAAKADVNQDSPLRAAASCGSLPIVEMLISNKADVNAKDNSGWTPLLKTWDVTIARLLIANGAQVNAKASRGETPLYLAVMRGDTNMAKLLLENGADPEVNDVDVNSSLSQGTLSGKSRGASTALGEAIVETYANGAELVELLLKSHANPNARFDWEVRAGQFRSEHGSTALTLAIAENKPEIVELLLAHGADPNLKTDNGGIPVVRAISLNRKEIVQSLIKHNAKLDIRMQSTPLLVYAADSPENRAGIVDLLCQSGLNINEPNDGGQTALHRAVIRQVRENVEALIARGADVNALDNDGKPPIAYTKPRQNNIWNNSDSAKGEAIAEILRKAGANDNYERLTRIWIRQQGESKPQSVFYKGTNSLNQFGLIETIAASYTIRGDTIPFPDLSRVTIDRLQADGKTSRIPVNVANILKSGDRTKDLPLQWGDIVEIPEQDHNVSVSFSGLPEDVRAQLTKWMLRNVTVMIKGQSNTVTLYPVFRKGTSWGASQFGAPDEVLSVKNPRVPNSFDLGSVLRDSRLLLVSSDLRRVRVNRANPVGDEPDEVVMDESKQQNPDLWLRDGDVIEVPERDPNAPVLPAVPSGAIPVGNPISYQWASPGAVSVDLSKAASGGDSVSFAAPPIAQPPGAPAVPAAPARAAFSVNLGAPSTGASASVANPNAQPTSATAAGAVGVPTPAAVPSAHTNAVPRPTRTVRPGAP